MQEMTADNSNHDDEISKLESVILEDTLKDLKSLRKQLYSAAEYFEVSFNNEKRKQRVMETLKDYALKALVNTVDHLGSVAYKIDNFVQQNGAQVSRMQLRLSCLEQRVGTCHEFVSMGGLSQQSLATDSAKNHKHYTCPAENRYEHENGKGIGKWHASLPGPYARLKFDQLKNVQAAQMESPSSFIWEEFFVSQSPELPLSPRLAAFPILTSILTSRKSESSESSPHHHQFPLPRSGFLLKRLTLPSNPSPIKQRYPRHPQRTTSLPVERAIYSTSTEEEPEEHSGKGKRLLKAMLSLRKSRRDHNFLDQN